MKRCAFLFIALLLPMSAMARFWDVPDDHPYGPAIDYLLQQGIVRGYPEDRSFRADLPVSRAEFVKLVVGTLFDDTVPQNCIDTLNAGDNLKKALAFPDASYDEWYGPFLCVAVLSDIIHGYPDGTFRPEDGVTFSETAKILSLAFGIDDAERHAAAVGIWYKPYVEDLEDFKAIPPTIRGFEYPVTRGEVAEMLYRLVSKDRSPMMSYKNTLTYDLLAQKVSLVTYTDTARRFLFAYPTTWPAPALQKRGVALDGIPDLPSDWRLYIGPAKSCLGSGSCLERDLYLDGYENFNVEKAVFQLYEDPSLTILDDVLDDFSWTILYEEETPACVYKRALIITDTASYRLSVACAYMVEGRSTQFDNLLRSFSLIEKTR